MRLTADLVFPLLLFIYLISCLAGSAHINKKFVQVFTIATQLFVEFISVFPAQFQQYLSLFSHFSNFVLLMIFVDKFEPWKGIEDEHMRYTQQTEHIIYGTWSSFIEVICTCSHKVTPELFVCGNFAFERKLNRDSKINEGESEYPIMSWLGTNIMKFQIPM